MVLLCEWPAARLSPWVPLFTPEAQWRLWFKQEFSQLCWIRLYAMVSVIQDWVLCCLASTSCVSCEVLLLGRPQSARSYRCGPSVAWFYWDEGVGKERRVTEEGLWKYPQEKVPTLESSSCPTSSCWQTAGMEQAPAHCHDPLPAPGAGKVFFSMMLNNKRIRVKWKTLHQGIRRSVLSPFSSTQ